MGAFELIVLIGVAVLAGELAARRFHLPPSLMLLVIGSGLSFVPKLHNAVLAPNVVLFVFLPALVYWESLNNTTLHEIRDNLRIRARHRLFIVWAGMRGSISLALALALPLTTNAGKPLPDRETLIAVTFAVIVFTITVQGLSMPAVLRWSRLAPDQTRAYEEALAARTASQWALVVLPGTAAALHVPDRVRDRVIAEYRAEADELTAVFRRIQARLDAEELQSADVIDQDV
jgi:NhaP-type Na+/H+ or K+/H+ antiporter